MVKAQLQRSVMVAFSSLAGDMLSPERYVLRQLNRLPLEHRNTFMVGLGFPMICLTVPCHVFPPWMSLLSTVLLMLLTDLSSGAVFMDCPLATAEGLCMDTRVFNFATMCCGTENQLIWLSAVFRVGRSLVPKILQQIKKIGRASCRERV